MEDSAKLVALAKVASALKQADVVWAVGASALLYLEGVVTAYHDFDLLITPEHLDKAVSAFHSLKAEIRFHTVPSATFASDHFGEASVDGVDFDILCGFAIRRKEAVYRYPFSQDRVSHTVEVFGESVPLSPLEDWFVLYLLMPGRGKMATALARYLRTNPRNESRFWLTSWLRNRLPGDVREKVMLLYGELNEKAR